MKTKIFLASIFAVLFLITVPSSYSQKKDGCKDKSSGKCGDMKTSNESKDSHCGTNGNAGGDSTVSATGITCLVSGEAIGEGQGLTFNYYGKTYNFCCEGCIAKFKKEPLNFIKDELTCPVMGEKIGSKDVFVIHEGTKYYLCCKSCNKKFKSDPEKFMKGYQD